MNSTTKTDLVHKANAVVRLLSDVADALGEHDQNSAREQRAWESACETHRAACEMALLISKVRTEE